MATSVHQLIIGLWIENALIYQSEVSGSDFGVNTDEPAQFCNATMSKIAF